MKSFYGKFLVDFWFIFIPSKHSFFFKLFLKPFNLKQAAGIFRREKGNTKADSGKGSTYREQCCGRKTFQDK
jgi:hypothetical protein